MDILGNLIAEVSTMEGTTISPSGTSRTSSGSTIARNSPTTNRRAEPAPELEGEADELIRFPLKHPFPRAVYALPWGRRGVPDYVRFADGVYRQAGTISRPFYELIDWPGVPAWLATPIDGDPVEPLDNTANDNDACYWCGRRLFYRTKEGLEFCACCDPIKPPKPGPVGKFSDDMPEASGESDLSFENVTFFLKPGDGFDW